MPTRPQPDATQKLGLLRGSGTSRNFITPLARGLGLLRAFNASNQWLGNFELASRAHLPKSTASRLAKSLATLGYLDYSRERHEYRLAGGVLALGYAAVANSPFRTLARADLQQFADDHHLFVAIGERDRLEIMVVECFHSNSSVLTMRLDVGSRVPIANTAAGWALLSALPEGEHTFLLDHMKKRYGGGWREISRGLTRAVSQIAHEGYCVSFGNWKLEVTSVAVPLVAADEASIMTVICSGAAPFLSSQRISKEVGPSLVALAKRLKGLNLSEQRED
jgi:DNA-binding IclR family transcriptional regulator